MKNGRTAAGTQRWKCPNCGASSSRKRPDLTRKAELGQFIDWLIGKHSQAVIDGTSSGRSFRRRIAWCWQLRPTIPVTGVVHDVIQVDGFHLRTGWCVLTARAEGNVIAYQWCSRESEAAWSALLQQLPPPAVVVCDGGPGIRAALRQHWPNTRIQRCLLHLQRNVRKYVTSRARTPAGRALWGLALQLTRVKTLEDAEAWSRLLLAWEGEFLQLTKQRTYRNDTPEVPSWVRPSQRWWFTHRRLRSGYFVFHRVITTGHLFTFLDPELRELAVPSTTNGIEGGTNAPMRLQLLHHRGMSEEHQRRAIEWWLYLHSERPDPTQVLAKHERQNDAPEQASTTEEDLGTPALYDTGLNPEEGLWSRKGWAGRS